MSPRLFQTLRISPPLKPRRSRLHYGLPDERLVPSSTGLQPVGVQWKFDRKTAAFAGHRADRHRMAEQIGAAFDNEKTETEAVPVRNLVVLVEDLAEHLLRNADPGVRDLNAEIAAPVTAADEDSSCPRVLDRVLDQIVKDAAEKVRVGNDLVPTRHHRQS